MFPVNSDWTLPKELPNLSSAKMISLDTETRDPDLKEKGPGVRRGGSMVGISVAVPEGNSWYFPFGHATGEQFEKETIMQWAKDNLCRANQPKVGANLLYDLDYLYHQGVKVTGPFYDIQNAEPLIDENRLTYSLDSLAKDYLGLVKDERLLRMACNDFKLKGSPQSHIWRLDPKYVGRYAEVDVELCIPIFEKQLKEIKNQSLEYIFDLETRLVPMLLHMRQQGVPIDVPRLMKLHENLSENLIKAKDELEKIAGNPVDFWAAESIAKIFDKMGESYPLTPSTRKPSFVKGWLEKHGSSIAQKIVKCRELDKLIGTFLEGSLLDMLVGDRIHCQFNQLRGDEFGTVTGRFSSSNPNLQFVPTRTDLGKLIRMCFIPDDGYIWVKDDHSQIEIRVLVHYAMGRGSKEIVVQFNRNPRTDYHQWCADEAHIERRPAKTINFGVIYGMGADKLSRELGITVQEARDFIAMYFEKLPFLKETVKKATEVANDRGYVRTLMGRRRRFPLFEPRDERLGNIIKSSTNKAKLAKQVNDYIDQNGGNYYRGVSRAGCYKAFNAVDQGSSADIMKKGMVDIWESGVCDTVKMYLTVHDELDYGIPKTKIGMEAAEEIARLMENTCQLKIPLLVDKKAGKNWGEVKAWDRKEVCGTL